MWHKMTLQMLLSWRPCIGSLSGFIQLCLMRVTFKGWKEGDHIQDGGSCHKSVTDRHWWKLKLILVWGLHKEPALLTPSFQPNENDRGPLSIGNTLEYTCAAVDTNYVMTAPTTGKKHRSQKEGLERDDLRFVMGWMCGKPCISGLELVSNHRDQDTAIELCSMQSDRSCVFLGPCA